MSAATRRVGALAISTLLCDPWMALAEPVVAGQGEPTATGKFITPTAAGGSKFLDLNPNHAEAPYVRANGPASLAVSPDGKLLAILTSGNNNFFDRSGKPSPQLSSEYVFLFDITGAQPAQLQVLSIRDSFQGLAWSPSSDRLFASGGTDDAVAEFLRNESHFSAGRVLQLGHKRWVGRDPESLIRAHLAWDCMECSREQVLSSLGNGWAGEVGGLAVSPDGKHLLVANVVNDSVSVIDIGTGQVAAEQDLRPGIINPKRHGQPGGSYPRAVTWVSSSRAYVISERDREVISLTVGNNKIRVAHRMPVRGQPVALLANHSGSRLYVALDTANRVAIFDTVRDKQIESLDVVAPESVYANSKMLGGANTNALALTPDEQILLVSNGGENAVAVVKLGDLAQGAALSLGKTSTHDADDEQNKSARSRVIGLLPTGWYPSGVATSKDGAIWYVVNGKSPTGPNASWCKVTDPAGEHCASSFEISPGQSDWHTTELNQHLEQLEKAGLLAMPAPSPLELARLTKQVAHNNRFDQPDKTAADESMFSFLREHIKHVIYIMKENQPYDNILGDLEIGNGDRRLTLFPERVTPNHHAIARNFVDLDNTLVSGDGSPMGWEWTYAAQTTDYEQWNEPRIYCCGDGRGRGVYPEWYGENRGINMGYATSQERHREFPLMPTDPDILPGTHDVNAPDGPGGLSGQGYIWDAALRGGLTVRNYGCAAEPWNYPEGYYGYPFLREPFASKRRVFWTTNTALMPYSDPYFYSFNPAYPDYWRVKEWKREFDEFSAAKSAPNLMVMWLANDHTGYWAKAIDGVNTPETQVADNDYALGLIIEAVAKSPFAKDTLVVSIEDDAWNGADHVDANRTIALFAGPYVRQHAVVSTRYTTVSLVKTIEEILGIGPIGLNDALAAPMSDVFDQNQATWTYRATVPDVLRSTQLPLPPAENTSIEYPRHSAAYWIKAMAGQDVSGPDRINPDTFNRTLWKGLKGDVPYP